MILVKYDALRYLRHIAGTNIKSRPLTGRTFLPCVGSSVWFCRFTAKPTGVLWKGLNVPVWAVGMGYACVPLDQFQRAEVLSDVITLWATATKKTGMETVACWKDKTTNELKLNQKGTRFIACYLFSFCCCLQVPPKYQLLSDVVDTLVVVLLAVTLWSEGTEKRNRTHCREAAYIHTYIHTHIYIVALQLFCMLWQHLYQNQTDTKISMDPAQGWHVNSWSISFFFPPDCLNCHHVTCVGQLEDQTDLAWTTSSHSMTEWSSGWRKGCGCYLNFSKALTLPPTVFWRSWKPMAWKSVLFAG